MKPERWKQVELLYHGALERDPDQRPAFIAEACAADEALRREVESLLSYDGHADEFIAAPALEVAARVLTKEPSEPLVGQQIGSYRIVSQLGAGGMGEVYLAEDRRLDRKVAIKFLPARLIGDEQARKRLIREARAAAKLDHPNICAIHEVGEEAGYSFIVMQYVEGETLASRIERDPLNVRDAIDFALQTVGALSEAHSHGIIHRDIKPQNIIINPRGQVKVLDFGLAKTVQQQSEARTETLLSKPGVIMGTVPYMSPEQVRGGGLDVRSDIFSFGAVLYEMISGRQPFMSESTAETISAILTREPPPLAGFADVPQELEHIVRRCLEKDRERRYQTTRDIVADLENVFRGGDNTRVIGTVHEKARLPGAASSRDRDVTPYRFRASRPALAVAASLFVALIAALVYVAVFRSSSAARLPQIKSLAVLPLENLSGDPTQEYFTDGMTEALITNLAQIRALKIVSRTSVMRFKGSKKLLPEIAEELNVDAILEGSVQQDGGRVKITTQLIYAASDTHLWARDYERDLSDILKLQGEVARAVADEIRIQVTAEERARFASARSVMPEAHESYLLGRYHLRKRNENDLRLAVEHFQRAIQIDPNYAAAYAGLADSWHERGIWGEKPFKEAQELSRSAAREALRLDDKLAEAHVSMCEVRFSYDWDWVGAEEDIKVALELDPGDPNVHQTYANLLHWLGRFPEAIAHMASAEQLDPLSSETQSTFGRILYRAGRYPEAIQHLNRAIELEPQNYGAYGRLGDVYEQMGKYDDAFHNLERAQSLSTRSTRGYAARLARVYAAWGRRAEALQILKDLQATTDPSRFPLGEAAAAWATLGDNNEAFRLLFKLVEERSNLAVFIKVDPPLKNLRSDKQFKELLGLMHFPPD